MNLFPSSFPGLDIAVKRSKQWSTGVQTAQSGVEQRARWWSRPRYIFTVKINCVSQASSYAGAIADELQIFQGLFDGVYGKWDSFLFVDPVCGNPSWVNFGTGNGLTTSFQLLDKERYPATYIQGTPTLYVAGTPTSAFALNATTGVVTFTAAPAASADLTWSGQFARPCRFDDDSMTFERFADLAWEGEEFKIVSIK